MNLFMCEWLKTRRTPLRWTVFLSPLIFSALILWYFSLRKTTLPVQIAIFEAFFEVWPALVIPAGAGLVSGLMVHQEGLAGNFGRLLGAGRPRRDLYLGKLAMLVFLVFTSTLLAVLALAAGIWFLFRETIAWPVFLGAAFMMMIGTLPLLAFHLWISFARGMGASIGIGGGGLLMASLMATSLGQTIWPFVPWAWPVRFAGLAGACGFDWPGGEFPPQGAGFVAEQAAKGLVSAAIFFLVMLTGGLHWFGRWEGRKMPE